MAAHSTRRAKIWSVVRVSSGNFLEMYDFFVFGYYASAIGKTFFPAGSDFAQWAACEPSSRFISRTACTMSMQISRRRATPNFLAGGPRGRFC
jgi:hypothetical protein